LVSLYRRAKAGVPDDLTGSGLVTGTFDFDRGADEQRLSTAFTGEIVGLVLAARSLDTQFEIGKVRFASVTPSRSLTSRVRISQQAVQDWLVFDPILLDLGGKRPVSVDVRISGTGLDANVRGEADLSRLLAASKTFGFAQRDYNAKGSANLDLTIQARWSGFAPPSTIGTAQLKNVSLISDGMASPLMLSSASILLSPELVTVDRIYGTWEGTRTHFEGAVRIPRRCGSSVCSSTFDLKANELSLDEVNRQLNPAFRRTDWLALPRRLIGTSSQNESALFSIHADGRLAIDRWMMKSLTGTKLTADIRLHDGVLEATDVRAEVFGSQHLGDWKADFTQEQPSYSGVGQFEELSLTQVGAWMQDNWAAGVLDGTYQLRLSGTSPAVLASTATGTVDFTWRNGILRNVVPARDAFAFHSWIGKAKVEAGVVRFVEGRMLSTAGPLAATGTVGFDRQLSLELRGNRQHMRVSGSLDKPIVEIQSPGTLASDTASNSRDVSDPKTRR
jgi:hypothetical protein